jgi:cellulose biosynthesis protein BcsQ
MELKLSSVVELKPSPLIKATQRATAAVQEEPSSSVAIATAESIPVLFQHSQLQRQLVALANVHDRTAVEPSILPLISAVGGCGVTTILATLGRALSVLGERVLLVDSEGPSTLPSFHNAQSQGTGLLLSTNPVSRFEGQVHVVRAPTDLRTVGQAGSTRFHRAMAELTGRLDHVIVAGGEWLAPALHNRERAAKNVYLVVVTPELRSTLVVPGILKAFGGDVEAWFLLNRFDAEDARDVQFRLQLKQSLGERLLPFCIPESPLVEDALLQGVCVVDLAPQSAIADAFFELAEWYRGKCGVESLSFRASEETQLAVSN